MIGGDLMERNQVSGQSGEKVTALKDSIVEECRKQGFTLNEFERLIEALRWEAEQVRRNAYANARF